MPRNTNKLTASLSLIHRRLQEWYKLHGRHHLPWRNTPDPYAIYVSEIMLQQTQVKTVLERYYQPFLTQFPTLAALAKAPSEKVMKAWEGLGYYTRARNLHAAAQQAGNSLPGTVEGLLALPGIGRNTAHAVASFGFKLPVPVMEANVKRVLARVFAMKKLDDAALWQHAEALLDRKNPFDYNQAMMDIGAMVCTKRNPRCAECPLNPLCEGKTDPEAYPAPKTAKGVRVREKNIVVLHDAHGRVLLMRRTTKFLGGLYGFIELDRTEKHVDFGGKILALSKAALIGQVTQVYSHFTLSALVYVLTIGKTAIKTPEEAVWARLGELGGLPLSRADSKIVALLTASGQQ